MLIKKRGKNIIDKIAKKLKSVYILYNRVLKKQIHCIRNLSLIQFALYGMILFFLVINMSFIKNDNRYFIKNELNQISDIFTKENIFNDEVNIEQAVFTSMKSSSHYPMIIQTLYFLVWKIFGFHRDYALYIIQFFYIILLYSTYFIGKEIKSPLAGILSTFVL